jgi:hypothetical protein
VNIYDYFTFGMGIKDREWSNSSFGYRFGFQGQESENDVSGNKGGHSNYKYRMSDNRLGRFFAVDPLAPKYPWNSPYAFSENRVTNAVELEGLEAKDLITGDVINMGTQIELEALGDDDYSLWRDMLKWEKSEEYQKAFDKADEGRYLQEQKMVDAFSDLTNTDYYAINIARLPDGYTQELLYTRLRLMLAEYTSHFVASFGPTLGTKEKWNSMDPEGSIIVFDNIFDDAPVLTTQAGEYHWVFTPVSTFWDSDHPLAGHRQFGLTANDDGSFTFYTRGIDRLWDLLLGQYGMWMLNCSFFKQTERLWNAVMDNAILDLKTMGIPATKSHNFNRRISWDNDIKENDK